LNTPVDELNIVPHFTFLWRMKKAVPTTTRSADFA